ncbi:conserved hypothetical protein [Klebsiella variicola]|nr:conserved hypothetical protein [Klebsiella variicola]
MYPAGNSASIWARLFAAASIDNGCSPASFATAGDCPSLCVSATESSPGVAELSPGTTSGSAAWTLNSGANASARLRLSADNGRPYRFFSNIPCPLLSHIAAHKLVGFITVYKDEKAFALPNVKKLKDYTTQAYQAG